MAAPEIEPDAPSDPATTAKKLSGWVGARGKPVEEIPKIANVPLPEAKTKVTRRIKLKTVSDVKAEMARVYRAAVKGEIAPEAATKLTYILQTHAKLIEVSDIEKRVAELEEAEGK
ncbi:hypothetical protein ACW9YQ_27865 (plasmid) [Paraburkholderia strydomiana]